MNHKCNSQASNLTDDLYPLGGHQTWEVVLIVLVTGPLSIITILGNLLVVVSFRVNRQLRTISNYYLLSLAVADLILGTVSMNLYTAYIIMGRWMLGSLACDLWLALDYVASNASVMNLLVISFDRFFSVTRPMTYRAKRTPRRAAVLIALAWVISFVLWAPAILFWPHTENKPADDSDCSIPFISEASLTFGTAIAAFYLPVSIMIILYWRIYWEIENRAKGLGKFVGSVSSSKNNSVKANKLMSCTQSSPNDTLARNPEKGSALERKTSFGCFPVRQNELSLEQGNAPDLPGKFLYREVSSRISNWNTEDEDDEDGGTSLTSEEDPEDREFPRSKTAMIRLTDLPVGSELQEVPRLDGASTIGDLMSRQPFEVTPVNKSSLRRCKMLKTRKINIVIREKKAARTLSAILLAFIVTWTPYNIIVLASISYCIPEKLWHLGYWLCYINSTVNPMCYALCNESFRATFKTLLLCRWGDARKWGGGGGQSRQSSVRPKKSCSTV